MIVRLLFLLLFLSSFSLFARTQAEAYSLCASHNGTAGTCLVVPDTNMYRYFKDGKFWNKSWNFTPEECPEGQSTNDEGVCEPDLELCEEGQVQNPETGICEVPEPEPCPSNWYWSMDLGQCVQNQCPPLPEDCVVVACEDETQNYCPITDSCLPIGSLCVDDDDGNDISCDDLNNCDWLKTEDLDEIEQTLTSINNNAADIKSDTSSIKSNTADIKSENSSIKNNSADIKSDTSSIKNNTADIKSDTSSIKKNTDDIKSGNESIKNNT
jgi:hypothetical protein